MFTNKYKTPVVLEFAMQNDSYIHGGEADYSATSLLMSPRQRQLIKRHGEQAQEDYRDMWAAFLGNAIHHEIERGLKRFPERFVVERKFTEFIGDKKVVAKVDAYDNDTGTLYDHKTCMHYAYNDDHKLEWEQQLNINAYLMRLAGFNVERLKIVALTKDWSKNRAVSSKGFRYPESFAFEFEIPIWSEEEQEAFILERIEEHEKYKNVPDSELPECEPEYTWYKPGKFAVHAPGVYAAKKLCDTREEAEEYMKGKNPSWYIDQRQSTCMRCENYCKVAPFCDQYREFRANN